MLAFTSIRDHKAGILAELLLKSYADLIASEQQYWLGEKDKWLQFDRDVFQNPDTIGRCVFITTLGTEAIGFASFDPRRRPESATVGHNCILPQFQGRGYGSRQVVEVLERLRALSVLKALVSTGEHPFFLPARKMYLACGFREIRRYAGRPDPRYGIVEFSREIDPLLR